MQSDVHDRTRGQEQNLFPDSSALLLADRVNFIEDDTAVEREMEVHMYQADIRTI
jgi:hypothetical protein